MRKFLDEKDYFGEVKMWHEGNRKKRIGVLVEAKSDEKFYSKHFQKDVVFFCSDGWENVVKVLEKVNNFEIWGVLGIIDADFKRLLAKVPMVENLFLTDYHDKEMMIVSSKAWKEILHTYTDKNKVFEFEKRETLKSVLLRLCAKIGCIRLLNEQENLGLKFKTPSKKGKFIYLKYSKFVNNALELDLDKLKKEVENKSNKPNFFQINHNYAEKF